jgi:hypothetical protein
MLEDLVLNHIKTYVIDTYERKEKSQQNLEVVVCRPLRQVLHWGRRYIYRVNKSSNHARPQWRKPTEYRLLNDMTKYLKIINTFLLNKAFSNQSRLIMLKIAIHTIHYLVYPTAINNIYRIIKRNQRPRIIIRSQRLDFILHSTMLSLTHVSSRKYNQFISRKRESSRERIHRRSKKKPLTFFTLKITSNFIYNKA